MTLNYADEYSDKKSLKYCDNVVIFSFVKFVQAHVQRKTLEVILVHFVQLVQLQSKIVLVTLFYLTQFTLM